MRFDVAMADPLGMYVGKRSEELIDVDLHLENGHGSLHLVEEAGSTVDGLRDELEDKVEVNFVFLKGTRC